MSKLRITNRIVPEGSPLRTLDTFKDAIVLPKLLLSAAGGGYTERSTRDAMELGRKVQELKPGEQLEYLNTYACPLSLRTVRIDLLIEAPGV